MCARDIIERKLGLIFEFDSEFDIEFDFEFRR